MPVIKNSWNSLFAKADTSAWEQFATEHQGNYVVGKGHQYDRVEINYLDQVLVFDQYTYYQVVGGKSYDRTYTRIRMEFKSRDDLQFRLTEQSLVDLIGKVFGMQDIRIGNKEFDRSFLIKGNDELKIQTLFSGHTIQKLILSQENVHLRILKGAGVFDEPIGEGNSMLYYLSETLIKDAKQLTNLLMLYKEIIDQLKKLSSIDPHATNLHTP